MKYETEKVDNLKYGVCSLRFIIYYEKKKKKRTKTLSITTKQRSLSQVTSISIQTDVCSINIFTAIILKSDSKYEISIFLFFIYCLFRNSEFYCYFFFLLIADCTRNKKNNNN